MSQLDQLRPIAQSINVQSRLPQRDFEWWGKMLTNLVLSVGSEDVSVLKYVTAVYSDERYEIAIVSDSLLILGETDEPSKEDADFSVRAFSLKEIISVNLNAEGSVFGDDFFNSWPGRMSVGIEHESAGSLLFPYSTEVNNRADAMLGDLVPVLLDIVRDRT